MMSELANGLFCCWVLLRNNYKATIFEGSLPVTVGTRCFVTCDCWTQTSWQRQRDSDCWYRGEPRNVILCEKKHGWICSNASTSM